MTPPSPLQAARRRGSLRAGWGRHAFALALALTAAVASKPAVAQQQKAPRMPTPVPVPVQPPAQQPRMVPDTPAAPARPGMVVDTPVTVKPDTSTEATRRRTPAVAPPLALDEPDALQQEMKLEAAGDLQGAERILRAELQRDPGSLSALISLERLLRVQGRLAEIVGPVQALLKTDPTSPIGYQMLVRAYSTLDRGAELQQASEAWIRATPKLETPYREIATVYRQRGDVQTTLQVLQRGRDRIGRQEALSFELGDLYASLGDAQNAAVEWSHFIGRDASGFNLVQRHAAALPDGGARLLPLLVDQLTRGSTSPARQRVAATLAVDAGLGPRAEAIVRQVAAGLKGNELQTFLVEVARRADGARLPSLAYWAYSQILAAGGPEAKQLAVRSRLAELALAAGDTVAARRNFAALEQASATGSPERRQALALRIQLAARSGDAPAAAKALASFRQEFPDALELDGVAATVGNAWLARGDVDAAAQAIAGVQGPRTSLVLGRLQLQRGQVNDARNSLLAAAAGLQGSDATEAIALVSLLGRLSSDGGQLLGRAVALTQEGKRKEAVDLLQKGAQALQEGDRPAVLDYAAGIADHAALDADAEALRRQIITVYPRALEAPASLLALGRALADRPASFEEARQMLERLIIDYPRSALVPQARRELDLLQGRIPRS